VGRAPVLKARMPSPIRGGKRVIVVVRPLLVTDGQIRLRSDLSAIDYARYLMDEGAPEGERKGHGGMTPELFTSDELMPPPQHFMERWEVSPARARGVTARTAWCVNLLRGDLPCEPHVYSAAVSFYPQDAERIDMQRFGKRLMSEVREDLGGAPLLSVMTVHRNTDHPHLHWIMRGVLGIEPGNELSGMVLKMPGVYRMKGIRSRAISLFERMLEDRAAS